MSTPSDVLHGALCARPSQTASELTLSVVDAGHAMTTAEVERLLAGDPRLRPDSSTPPRWRALGAGQPAASPDLPTPRRQVEVVAPAAASEPPAAPPVAAPTARPPAAPTSRPVIAWAYTPSSAPTSSPTVTPAAVAPPDTDPVTPAVTPVAAPADALLSTPSAEHAYTPVVMPPSARPTALAATPSVAPTVAGGLFQALAAPPVVERGPARPGGEVRYVGPQLHRWQKDVLDAWLAEGRRGIVEAVIAGGRLVVGVLAAWDARTRGEKVLVLVPTSDLLDAWFSTLELTLPGLSIGRRDLTTTHTFDECDVLVSLVSAAFGHQLLPEGTAGLLIADEVHAYGSARPAETLREGFGARLGLTTTMQRQDPGFDEVLRPYFGAVLEGCDLRRGRQDGVLAPLRLGFVAVDLAADEQVEHDALCAQIADLAQRLTEHGCAEGRFVDDVVRLQGSWRENARGAADASAYLRAVSARRDLLATSAAKIDAVATLAPTLARSAHSLVFTHTKDSADAAATALRAAGVPTAWWHNGLEPEVRRTVLRDLRGDRLTAIAAPKVLDGGLDLPTVDAVVLLAASRSSRQLLQRVSAVLPVTETGRLPVVLVVHARGTVDADDGFVADLAAVATEVRTFDVGTSSAAIAAWSLGAERAAGQAPVEQERRTDAIEATTPSTTVTELTAPANGASPPDA